MTLHVLAGARYLVPYVRLFPIWRYGPRVGFDGRSIGDGWYPDPFGVWEITREQAEEKKAA